MKTYQNQPFMEVNMPVPWIVSGNGKKGTPFYCTKKVDTSDLNLDFKASSQGQGLVGNV